MGLGGRLGPWVGNRRTGDRGTCGGDGGVGEPCVESLRTCFGGGGGVGVGRMFFSTHLSISTWVA